LFLFYLKENSYSIHCQIILWYIYIWHFHCNGGTVVIVW